MIGCQCFGTAERPEDHSKGLSAKLCIVTELCKHGSLDQLLHIEQREVRESTMLGWMEQIAAGMDYLHDKGILHRDLKAGNVLIDANKMAKLCDFGVSKFLDASLISSSSSGCGAHTGIGTADYQAPEVIQAAEAEAEGAEGGGRRSGYGRGCDVYSYGVLINEMAARARPWSQIKHRARAYTIMRLVADQGKRPVTAQGVTDDFARLVAECWAQEPMDRPPFAQIVARVVALSQIYLLV